MRIARTDERHGLDASKEGKQPANSRSVLPIGVSFNSGLSMGPTNKCEHALKSRLGSVTIELRSR
jgi:hypothetical protein